MIAITRPLERSRETVKQVEARGHRAMIVPAVSIIPVSREEITEKIGELTDYEWLVLSSAFGADIMHRYFGDGLKNLKIAVIGPKTAKFLEEQGIRVELIPKEYRAETLADEMVKAGIEGKRVLVARADIGREVLITKLQKHADVTEVTIYKTIMPCDKTPMREFLSALEKGRVTAAIFTSSQNVKNLFASLDKDRLLEGLKKTKVCAIGPITTRTLEERGIQVDVTPREYTVEACLEAIS
jgi:uroporphyrinogen-III synthase